MTMTQSMWGFALTALVLCSFCVRPNLASEESECVAQATAEATELESAAEAVSNAVAATLTKTINCDTGELEDGNASLSIALALAISVAREIGQNCTSDADAQAGLAGELVGREILVGLDNVDAEEANSKVFDAGARALGESAADTVNEDDVDIDQAEEIAEQIFEAAREILTALKCDGKNVNPAPGECRFLNQRFIGDCEGQGSQGSRGSRGSQESKGSQDSQGRDCTFLFGMKFCN
ncbi:hypothetical protein BSKO_05211 [Bryopsis sp. KO-2023]|nr:hypothetical protein BSKO_05211 [Bryopsis sp. KO-2023]